MERDYCCIISIIQDRRLIMIVIGILTTGLSGHKIRESLEYEMRFAYF